ncbi:MAG: ribosome biogenesis GTP-binding protein YihA/YsxC [Bacteriovoracaceae bacterium]
MAEKIFLGEPEFLFAFSDINQLQDWFAQNKGKEMKGMAFVGRSNVGKSSFINALFDTKIAKTSKTPGRTQAVNIFRFFCGSRSSTKEKDRGAEVLFFDLPGYGFAEVSKEMSKNWGHLMTNFFSLLTPEVLILNIQDARRPNQEADKMFYSFISQVENEIILVLNKSDKLKSQKEKHELNKEIEKLKTKLTFFSEVITVSSMNHTNIDPVKKILFNRFK